MTRFSGTLITDINRFDTHSVPLSDVSTTAVGEYEIDEAGEITGRVTLGRPVRPGEFRLIVPELGTAEIVIPSIQPDGDPAFPMSHRQSFVFTGRLLPMHEVI